LFASKAACFHVLWQFVEGANGREKRGRGEIVYGPFLVIRPNAAYSDFLDQTWSVKAIL